MKNSDKVTHLRYLRHISRILMLILFLHNINNALSQIDTDWYEPINSITIEYDDSWAKVYYLTSSLTSISTSPGLYYFWFLKNEIHVTRGGYGGKLLHNGFTSHYLSNSLKEKGRFYYGLKDGTWTEWYESGMLKKISNWKRGKLNGKQTNYDINGEILIETEYKDGLMHGYAIKYENGEEVETKQYKNGSEIKSKRKKKQSKKESVDTVEVKNSK